MYFKTICLVIYPFPLMILFKIWHSDIIRNCFRVFMLPKGDIYSNRLVRLSVQLNFFRQVKMIHIAFGVLRSKVKYTITNPENLHI